MQDDSESGFLKTIAENPHDDNPRMVYADWLQDYENGNDPNRAELIRIQCNLERGIDWASGFPADDERLKVLRDREQELIKEMLVPKPGERPGIRELTPEIAAIVATNPLRIRFKRGMIYKLNLTNTPIATLPPGLHVGGDLNLWGTGITALPPDLYVGGDLDLWGNPITTLPSDLHVGGNLNLFYTRIITLPHDLHVGGSLYLRDTPLTALPPGLHIGGDLDLTDTRITELPPDLHVGGILYLRATHLNSDAARHILTMPNLSAEAKIIGMQTAGFPALAAEASRQAAAKDGPGTPPRQPPPDFTAR